MGWITTVLAGLACTAATGAAIYWCSHWLLDEHNSRAKAHAFRASMKAGKQRLKSIQSEYQLIKSQLIKNGLEPTQKLSSQSRQKQLSESDTGSSSADETASVNSSSTVAISEKKVLEFEEVLTRLLERIDTVKPRTNWSDCEMDKVLPKLDTKEAEYLRSIATNLVLSKKKLILSIETWLSVLQSHTSAFASPASRC